MTEKYKIIGRYIKDLSSETPDAETYIFVKDRISKYQLGLDINWKALKNKMLDIDTRFKFQDGEESKKKSYCEIWYSTILKVNESITKKYKLEKIVLCDVQKEVFPEIEKALLSLLHTSGYPDVKFLKKVNLDEFYKKNFN